MICIISEHLTDYICQTHTLSMGRIEIEKNKFLQLYANNQCIRQRQRQCRMTTMKNMNRKAMRNRKKGPDIDKSSIWRQETSCKTSNNTCFLFFFFYIFPLFCLLLFCTNKKSRQERFSVCLSVCLPLRRQLISLSLWLYIRTATDLQDLSGVHFCFQFLNFSFFFYYQFILFFFFCFRLFVLVLSSDVPPKT